MIQKEIPVDIQNRILRLDLINHKNINLSEFNISSIDGASLMHNFGFGWPGYPVGFVSSMGGDQDMMQFSIGLGKEHQYPYGKNYRSIANGYPIGLSLGYTQTVSTTKVLKND